MKKITFLLVIILWVHLSFSGKPGMDEQKTIIITKWLKAGNFPLKLPAFSDVQNIKGNKFSAKELLKFDYTDIKNFRPVTGYTFKWDKIHQINWDEENADKNGYIHPGRSDMGDDYSLAYYATYIFADRWTEVEINIECPQLCLIYLDGEELAEKLTPDKDNDKPGIASKKIKLERGNHLLVVKTLRDKDCRNDWKLKGQINIDPEFQDVILNVSLKHKQIMTISHLLEGEKIKEAKISPDGKYYALTFKETEKPDGKTTNRTEIRKTEDHSLVHSFRNSKASDIEWSPDNLISYIVQNDKESTLWLFDLDKGIETKLLDKQKDLAGYRWAPNGEYIIYSIAEEPDKNETGVKKLEGMPDRWPWWRKRTFLYKFNIDSGIKERITYGNQTTSLQDISNDSRYILFTHGIPDFSELPYSKEILFRLNLQTYKLDTIWSHKWRSKVSYSPDDKFLLVLGGTSVFSNIGENTDNGKTTNNYDTQAYIYNIKDKSAEAVTRDFDPSIQDAYWSRSGKHIYFLTADRTYKKLYRYEVGEKTFNPIKGGPDVIENIDFANTSELAVFIGSSISTPPKAYLINLDKDSIPTIAEPENEHYKDVVFGKNENWTFRDDEGLTIDGRIYFPPDFESDKKYPLIVYYYGGTSPSDRGFGGRYPKNLFAAQGYVVYVLQPGGTYGYGQNFSAIHVNNWGKTVADQIITGTRKFIDEHPFIDKDKVGCIGASYGGFMTMLIQTRTDIFRAAVAHAGISSISSYWGEGYWGYLYSAVASANSFPWNNKELYIEQSPLFLADRINTPLLLLHGSSDTNVPPGESRQLYTALKLLGKDVELVEIEDQDHHILDFKKRILWQKTILAWFDKWLKDQPAWWKDLYPEENF